jgi:hypothetical protein
MQFAPDPASIAALAHGAQIIATNIDVMAALRVATGRNHSAAAARALKPPIIVYDFAHTAIIIIERRSNPIATHGLANSA